jgi:predicted ribosome quality control (RQC) complex YloA/Tae2 family protein
MNPPGAPLPVIPFDALTLAAVASEIQSHLPARVQKIQQPTENEVILVLFGRQGAARLLLCVDPRQFRVHFTQQRRENPIAPPSFCQVSRKYLDGALLTAVEMPVFDRILHFEFRAHDGERVAIVAELMGRNSNLILISGSNTVRGVLRPAPADSPRALRPGASYSPPPGKPLARDPRTVIAAQDPVFAAAPDEERDLPAFLRESFSGIGKLAAVEIAARASTAGGPGPVMAALMVDVRGGRFSPHAAFNAEGESLGAWPFALLSLPPDRQRPEPGLSLALDRHYADLAARTTDSTARRTLSSALDREIAYREQDLRATRVTIAEAGRADSYEQTGNNLLAALSSLHRGDAEAIIPDLYSPTGDGVTTVALDPKRSPQENAERYFDRARKARDAAVYADGRAADRVGEIERLGALRTTLVAADEEGALEEIRRALVAIVGEERLSGKAATDAPANPYGGFRIRKFDVDGYQLLVGESADANDHLTTRIASPSDLWMHVRSAPGAHGVLRTGGQPTRVPEAVIRRAAAIVAARSGTAVKHAGVVAVDIVEKRHVRKPRGAKPGLVTYQRERVLDVAPGS